MWNQWLTYMTHQSLEGAAERHKVGEDDDDEEEE